MKNIMALIPARAGSVRVVGKNLQRINRIPLIGYTIRAATQSRFVNRIIVSTDSVRIANVARRYGAEIPFMRPRAISGSKSTEMQFLRHTLSWLKDNEGYVPDLIVLLYPTAPFRRPQSIDAAVRKMLRHPMAHSLRSIKKCSEHPYKMWRIKSGYIKPFVHTKLGDAHTLSYSLLPEVYVQNANIYITKPSTIQKCKSPTGNIILPFIMDELESVDINNPIDLFFARAICKKVLPKKQDA